MKDQRLNEKLKELDNKDLETSWSQRELWEAVESKMEGKKGKQRFLPSQWKALPWAAIVLLGLSMYWWSIQEETTHIEVVEVMVNAELPVRTESYKQLVEGKDFILEACRKELEVCESPPFQQLYEELSRIEEEKVLLAQAVKQYGADEVATRAMIQLENAESAITSQLVSMIII